MQLRKAPSSFILYVSLSAWSSATSSECTFVKFHIWDLSLSVRIYLFCLKDKKKHLICLNSHVQSLVLTLETGCFLCEETAEAEEKVDYIDITMRHDRL
jgi:hypothetical protein